MQTFRCYSQISVSTLYFLLIKHFSFTWGIVRVNEKLHLMNEELCSSKID